MEIETLNQQQEIVQLLKDARVIAKRYINNHVGIKHFMIAFYLQKKKIVTISEVKDIIKVLKNCKEEVNFIENIPLTLALTNSLKIAIKVAKILGEPVSGYHVIIASSIYDSDNTFSQIYLKLKEYVLLIKIFFRRYQKYSEKI
jgi:uncharacterized protein YerC